jgi:hypothetical protein
MLLLKIQSYKNKKIDRTWGHTLAIVEKLSISEWDFMEVIS